MAGAARALAFGAAPLRWLPVHPARRPNDSRGQVSWLPDRCRRPAFPCLVFARHSGVVERGSPVTVAGAAGASNPVPSASWRSPARPSRAIRDVGRELTTGPRAVQLWHGGAAADAAGRVREYPIGRAMTHSVLPAEPRPRVDWIEGSLDDSDSLRRLVSGARSIVHFAGVINARDPADFDRGNAQGTLAMLAEAVAAI